MSKGVVGCGLSTITSSHTSMVRSLLQINHCCLRWLSNFKHPEVQMAHWLERLHKDDFDIVHRRGCQHQNAYFLSGLPCKQYGRKSHQTVEPEMVVDAVIAE